MHPGRKFFFTCIAGLVSLTLLLTGICLPDQLVLETQPYARLVLLSDQIDQWTASQLSLDPADLEAVKANHKEYLLRNSVHGIEDGSEDSGDDDDSDSESEDIDDNEGIRYGEGENGRKEVDLVSHIGHAGNYSSSSSSSEADGGHAGNYSSSSSSSEADGEASSSESEHESGQTLIQMLETAARRQMFHFGLFRTYQCTTRQNNDVTCSDVVMTEALRLIETQAHFMDAYINMPMWNNLRVESVFSVIACCLGLICLFSSLRPCCESKRMPVYLSALSFCFSGILVFIPVVRLTTTFRDIQQNLEANYNVTTKLSTPWSLVLFGLGFPFALLAAFLLVATKWYRATKQWRKMWEHNTEKDHLTAEQTQSEIRMTRANSAKTDAKYAN